MESTVAFLLVIDVVTLIFTTIWPNEDTLSFHFIVSPLSFVFTAVGPVVDTYRNKKAQSTIFDIIWLDKINKKCGLFVQNSFI